MACVVSKDLGDMDGQFIQTVANVLSTITILSCLFLKVPQIMYLREKRTAEGIYVQAMLMEILGFTIVSLYNYLNDYSLLTYLEYPIILLQIFVMLYYVLKYQRLIGSQLVPLGIMTYFLVVTSFLWGVLVKDILSYLVPLCTPLSGFAKVTYIYGIVRSSNADAVSLTTWVISVCTNLARLFTVYVDSNDTKLMVNFAISALLSMAVLATAVFYKARFRHSFQNFQNNRQATGKAHRLHPHRD